MSVESEYNEYLKYCKTNAQKPRSKTQFKQFSRFWNQSKAVQEMKAKLSNVKQSGMEQDIKS